ncbi:hypothetical protein SNEBB_001956 [Seison nebaliae]|nr:hypothetical protein SNEBB_001956 [Seison nebaliae]
MDLFPTYKPLLMADRRNILSLMAHNSNKKVAGFFNDAMLGICGTNVVFGLIMSSRWLMEIVREKRNACSNRFYDGRSKVLEFVEYKTDLLPPIENNILSNILVDGLCTIDQNITYQSKYGLSGQYCLFKAIKEKELTFDRKYPYDEIDQQMTTYTSPLFRFHVLVVDLLDGVYREVLEEKFLSIYYPNLKVLNVEFVSVKGVHNYLDIHPFLPTYLNFIGDETIGAISHKIKYTYDDVEVIHLGFEYEPGIKLHDRTYLMFVEFLTIMILEDYNDLPYPDFSIFLNRQLFTVPRINRNILLYPFPIEQQNRQYQLKALSINLYNEAEINLKEIPISYTKNKEITECVENIRQKTLNYIHHRNNSIIPRILNKYLIDYEDQFNGLCRELLNKGELYTKLMENTHRVHSLSVISKDGIWYCMNDDQSFQIDDIERFSVMIENEIVEAVVLEKIEKENYELLSTKPINDVIENISGLNLESTVTKSGKNTT